MRFAWVAVLMFGCVSASSSAQDGKPRQIIQPMLDDAPAPRGAALLRRDMLAVHNAARAKVGAPPLAWSDDLAVDAARYAETLAATDTFRHAVEPHGKGPEGESLFKGSLRAFRYDEMAQFWVAEQVHYRAGVFPQVSDTGKWHDVGHYTQIIWRGTTAIGCGLASSATDDYLVCRYGPPGNVFGRRAEQ